MPSMDDLNQEFREKWDLPVTKPSSEQRAMKSKMKITKTQRKWWVLSTAHHNHGMDQGHEISYTSILAVCKTKKEAEK